MKMRIKNKLILLSAIIVAVTGCVKEEKVSSVENAKWLAGTWEGKTNSGLIFYEKWVMVNDTLMRNINYHIANSDTVIGGKSSISARNGKLVYTNFIGNKEENWRTTKLSDIEMVFENGGVSHAQKISFFKSAADRWEAALFGSKDTSRYLLKRIAD